MESRFNLDKARRTCVIDASTDVGSDLARIFTGFATKEYGERSVLIERTQPSGCACASKHRAAPATATAGVAV
jgi:predicted site-specific integrase-resolvase